MDLDVYLEISGLCAGVIALFATERFFSGMNQHVSLELRRICVGVRALFTTERFFFQIIQHLSVVLALVLFQIPSSIS